MKKMLKIKTSSTKTMNTPSAGKISSTGNPKIEFGKLKQMFLTLESKIENFNYLNKNAKDPIGQPYASKIIANYITSLHHYVCQCFLFYRFVCLLT